MYTTSGTAKTGPDEFLEAARTFLNQDYLPRLRRTLEHLDEEDLWWRPNEASNSVGNLILHLCGNVRQWIVGGVGDTAVDRDRPAEFAARGPIPKSELLVRIEKVVAEATRVLSAIPPDALLRRVHIQRYDVSKLQAVFHVIEHFSYHLGQIIYVTKLRRGQDLRFYDL